MKKAYPVGAAHSESAADPRPRRQQDEQWCAVIGWVCSTTGSWRRLAAKAEEDKIREARRKTNP
jgi:hypothetical protein